MEALHVHGIAMSSVLTVLSLCSAFLSPPFPSFLLNIPLSRYPLLSVPVLSGTILICCLQVWPVSMTVPFVSSVFTVVVYVWGNYVQISLALPSLSTPLSQYPLLSVPVLSGTILICYLQVCWCCCLSSSSLGVPLVPLPLLVRLWCRCPAWSLQLSPVSMTVPFVSVVVYAWGNYVQISLAAVALSFSYERAYICGNPYPY